MKRITYFLLLTLFLADVVYSFRQHYAAPLDGDMAPGILPADDSQLILEDPLGLNVIINGATYLNPNRFFCHWSFVEYFSSAPVFLQKFVQPVESIYLACAFSKILIQFGLIWLLAAAITGTKNMFKLEFIIAMVLVTPFFQTNGYNGYMGIIDKSATYVFFYALPCTFLIFYLLPFVFEFYHHKKIAYELLIYILWIPLPLIVCLSGPLNAGVILIFSLLVFFINLKTNYTQPDQGGVLKRFKRSIKAIPKKYWFYFLPVNIFALYSLYVGSFNSYTISSQIPLSELYLRLPQGIYSPLTQKLGVPLLIIILIFNASLIIKKFDTQEGKKIVFLFKWLIVFSVIYILLLPLGGYRNYRPHVIRYDTLMPITLAMLFMWGLSTLYILRKMSNQQKKWYVPVLIGITIIYTNADDAKFDMNHCEMNALSQIYKSKESIVKLNEDCPVLSWETIRKPEESELNAQLLLKWKVTKGKKLYFYDKLN